jgi:Ca-activated chloride channel family protein
MIESFRFYSPLWFLLGPMVIAAVWWAHHPRRRAAAVFSSIEDLKSLPVTFAQQVRRTLPWFYCAGLLLIVAALARPQRGRSESQVSTEGIAIEMALDVSGSMEALDFNINGQQDSRINAVKHVFKQFVAGGKELKLSGRPNDLIGVVAFGGFADSKCPLTMDHGALLDVVNSLEVPKRIRDSRGRIINMQMLQEELQTAIGDGLSLAVDRLRNVQAKSKILILLTDGDNNAGVVEPKEAAKIAKDLGIKIYAIGIGNNGVAPIRDEDEFGRTFLRRERFHIDEDLLKSLAEIGGGKYFNATNTEALGEIYSEIDRMEKSKVEERRYTEYTDLYPWLAGPGIALVLGVGFLTLTRFRALP